jgi:hypothetical protein
MAWIWNVSTSFSGYSRHAREKTILFSAHDADFVSDSGAVAIEMTSLVGSAHLTGAMAAN